MRSKAITATIVVTMLAGIVTTHSCKTKGTDTVAPAVSFSKDIQPIFAASCAINSNCHVGASNTNGHINLDSADAYTTIISKQLVNTGNPTASLMYVEISSGIMPKAPYAALPAASTTLILEWIQQGAKNN